MTRASSAGVIVLALIGAAPLLHARTQQQNTPVFRARTDVVSVDVSVTRARRPVTGLIAKDFLLTDNGVEQVVDTITVEALAIDVSLVVDLSGSTASTLERFKADIQRMVGMLRPTDRIRLIRFSDDVRQIVPMQPATEPLPLDDLRSGQSTSLNDALFVALARPAEINRRHLIVVFTDADDTWSAIENSSLPVIASRADAVLHVVLSTYDRTLPTLAPAELTSRQALRQAAEGTGGDVRYLRDAVGAFRQVLDEFRTSYVLRYTPRGVPRGGWHDVDVKVTRAGTYSVRARRGYFGG